jgi:hypothetical protein
VLPLFAPDFDKQIGRAIHDLRHFGETRSNVYKAEQLTKRTTRSRSPTADLMTAR